jgi:nitrate reductase NapE component
LKGQIFKKPLHAPKGGFMDLLSDKRKREELILVLILVAAFFLWIAIEVVEAYRAGLFPCPQ